MTAGSWRRRFAVFALLAACGAPATAAPGDAAEILDIQGRAEQRPNAVDPWTAARIRQTLGGGAFVRTGTASKLALLFADETQVRLNQNTVLEIKPPDGGNVTTLRLEAWQRGERDASLVLWRALLAAYPGDTVAEVFVARGAKDDRNAG